jgi:hypothetical protein
MGAEFMQPGLVQLQPTLDDFMDTFEPLQGSQLNISYYFYFVLNLWLFSELFFNPSKTLPTLPEETTVDNTNVNIVGRQNSKVCQTVIIYIYFQVL